MSTNDETDDRRRVETEVTVRATPEAVWEAIATGGGMRSWFMGMEVEFEERVGGAIRMRMGDDLVPWGTVTAWDPSRRLGTRTENAFGPGSPPMAYEWTIEAAGGGECTLRMVQTLFTDDDAWDTQVGDTAAGWPAFFHVLANYVERHAGEPSGVVQAMGPVPGEKAEALERLARALGVTELTAGAPVASDVDGVPAFAGEIEAVVRGRSDRVMLRLERPFPGTGWIGVGPIGGSQTAIVTFYYYGEGAPEASARDHARLVPWLQAHGQASAG
jgi:uncharacterized protein YndB with AHSA1/START domain